MQQNDKAESNKDSGNDPNTPTNRVWLLSLALVAAFAVLVVAYVALRR